MTKTNEITLWVITSIITVLYLGYLIFNIITMDTTLVTEEPVVPDHAIIRTSVWERTLNK